MQLFFAGAEVPSHLSVLKDCGVERVAVSLTNLVRSVGDNIGTWATTQRLGGLEWVLYADSNHVPVGPALEVLKDCEVQPEIVTGPIDWYEQTWLSNTDLLFLPIWDAADPTMLRDFTSNYDGVTLPDVVVNNPTAVRQARASINKLGQLAALTGRSKGIERFDTLVSSAWWAVQKYGETQVWAGNRLMRLNAEDKVAKREKYASVIESLGCDIGKIMEDDPTENLRLAVVSWQHLERHLVRGRVVANAPVVTSAISQATPVTVISPSGVASPVAHSRHELLPVMGLGTSSMATHDDEGNEVEEHFSTIQVTAESLRQCNTCILAVSCPMHTPNALCSYKIPVEIKSKPQLVGVLRAITEIQTQRILMGRFSEEIMGEPNPDLGKEMDRLFSMVERWRNIEDTRDSVKMTLEAKGDAHASMGVISRLFGQRAGANATLLETPVDSNEIIEQMTDDD